MGEDDAATRQGRRVGFVLGSVVYVQNSAGFHLGLIFLAISYNWCLWFSGWWFERFPLQALLSSSQTEGDEAAQALLCQLQGFYQRPISPRWIVNPFLSMKNNFWWREGPGWQQNSSLCSSLHANSQTWEAELYNSSGSHRSGIFLVTKEQWHRWKWSFGSHGFIFTAWLGAFLTP